MMIAELLMAQLALSDVRVIDADTLRSAEGDFRLQGVDTPEIKSNAGCPEEDVLGEAATRRVEELVRGARVEAVPGSSGRFRHDRYGRSVVRITIDGRDLGEILIREGRTVERPGTDWCERRCNTASSCLQERKGESTRQ